MIKDITKKILLTVILATALFAFSPRALADFPGNIKDWNSTQSPVMSQSLFPTSADAVCAALFNMDQKNIFKEGICAIINVISISTADFAQNVTCTIQNVAADNFLGATATTGQGNCTLSGGADPSGDKIYGNNVNPKSGFFDSKPSNLSKKIIDTTNTGWIQKGYSISRGVVLVMAIIMLLIVAFSNILHIDLNTYAIKKILPNLVIGILLGFISATIIYLLSRFIDILYGLRIFSPYESVNPMLNIFNGHLNTGADTSGSAPDFSSISLVFRTGSTILGNTGNPGFITGLIGTIILVISSVVVFAYEYVMALRPLVIGLLTIVSPIAFICLVLPQTQIIMKKWWSLLLIALFYPVIVNFVFFIMNSITASSAPQGAVFLIAFLFKTTVLALLIRLPFTIESDLRKLTVSLAKTDFGANLGLSKLVNTKEISKNTSNALSTTENNLKTREAQGLIASATNGFFKSTPQADKNELKTTSSEKLITTINNRASQNMPSIVQIANSAFKTNASRPTNLLVKSTEDLGPDTFRKAITHSNTQLWQDNTAIEELKRKNGQVLDEEGTAIRADSARRLYRLAQVVDQDKIANPEAVKLMAKKGMLDVLPLNIIQKAISENLINRADLAANFKQNAERVFERAMTLKPGQAITPSVAQQLIEKDRFDYSTGFKDIARQFSDISKDEKIIPPPPPIVTQNIISNMKNADPNVFDKNGMYFLQRLGGINRQSQASISNTLQKDGVNPQTANSISQNPQLDIKDVKNYVPGGNISHENIGMLREGFLNRDLSNNLITNVAQMISESKIAVSKSITQKLADNLKNDEGLNLSSVKTSLQNSIQELSKASPEKIKEIGQEINKYHPGTMIKTSGDLDAQDVQKLQKDGEDVIETIDTIEKSGGNEEKLRSGTDDVAKMVEDQISGTIQKALSGEANFDEEATNEPRKGTDGVDGPTTGRDTTTASNTANRT
jgi:hypothetical protein